MTSLLGWIKKATTMLVDPEREARIGAFAADVEKQLINAKDNFDFGEVVAALGVPARDQPLVADCVFTNLLKRVWRDQRITERERLGLDFVAGKLGLTARQRHELEQAAGIRVFEAFLAGAVSDGRIDKAERETLDRIAVELRETVRSLVKRYFSREGEGFLRGLFASAVERGTPDDEQFRNLLAAADALGVTRDELHVLIRPQAERCVEHVLADAKADEYLDAQERESLTWLLDNLGLSGRFAKYVEAELEKLTVRSNIRDGILPSLPSNDPMLRAGEIVHFQAKSRYTNRRSLKSGTRVDHYDGGVIITDTRLVFSSPEKPFEIKHGRVIDLLPVTGGFQLRTTGKGTGEYQFDVEGWLVHAIFKTAVGKANQKIVVRRDSESPSRHIPRDVRQRVWQKYGGVCAECRADQYLEFDHIIPVAKGGSNAEANVQLLCRKCNLKKSDRI